MDRAAAYTIAQDQSGDRSGRAPAPPQGSRPKCPCLRQGSGRVSFRALPLHDERGSRQRPHEANVSNSVRRQRSVGSFNQGGNGSRRTTRHRCSYDGSAAVGCLACRDPMGSHGRMRTSLIIACAIVAYTAGAQAQDAFTPCRQIKDDGKRLKCYDRLDRSASGAQERSAQRRGASDTGWIITDEKSPLDDSPLVSAALASTDDRSHLLMRCKDRRTKVAVSMTGFIKCGADVPVDYRIDQENAVATPSRCHAAGFLAIGPPPLAL